MGRLRECAPRFEALAGNSNFRTNHADPFEGTHQPIVATHATGDKTALASEPNADSYVNLVVVNPQEVGGYYRSSQFASANFSVSGRQTINPQMGTCYLWSPESSAIAGQGSEPPSSMSIPWERSRLPSFGPRADNSHSRVRRLRIERSGRAIPLRCRDQAERAPKRLFIFPRIRQIPSLSAPARVRPARRQPRPSSAIEFVKMRASLIRFSESVRFIGGGPVHGTDIQH
jgi:hypothetical protein